MSSSTPFTRPVKTIVFYFLALCAVAMAVAAAKGVGVIDNFAEKRALGMIVGIMAAVVGNFLPKMRPLQGWYANVTQAMAAERFAGWTLVLVGITYIMLFAFLPLNQARPVSAMVGTGAILIIAADWIWLASSAAPLNQQSADTTAASGKRLAEKRRLLVLLFAFFWVFATACAAFLFSTESWFSQFGWWMTTSFWILYAALTAFLDCKRSARTHLAAR